MVSSGSETPSLILEQSLESAQPSYSYTAGSVGTVALNRLIYIIYVSVAMGLASGVLGSILGFRLDACTVEAPFGSGLKKYAKGSSAFVDGVY